MTGSSAAQAQLLLAQSGARSPREWHIRWDWSWPAWLCVLVAIAIVGWVVAIYFREASSAGKPIRTLLALLRLMALALVVAMIAQPAVEWFETGRLRLVVLVDRSASMDTRDETSAEGDRSRLEACQSLLTQGGRPLLDRWRSIYDLDVVAFDQQFNLIETQASSLVEELRSLTTAADQNAGTRLGDAVDYALRELPGASPTAVVLLTDGISTQGQTLEKAAQRAKALRVPLFPVAIGSPHQRPDVAIENLLAEEVVFPGDRMQVEATVRAIGYGGRETTATLRDTSDGRVLAQTTVRLPEDGETQTVRLATRPEIPGKLPLRLEIDSLEGEMNLENNAAARTVEVRDEKIRVLLVQASPSYEYRALKSLLERDPAIELRVHLQEADADFQDVDEIALAEFPSGEKGLMDYDVVLLGDVDPTLLPRRFGATLEQFVVEHGGGLACIAGPRFMPHAFRELRRLRVLLPIELSVMGKTNGQSLSSAEHSIQPTALGQRVPSLQLGETADESQAIWQELPPVMWLFEVEKAKPGAQVLAQHGSRNTRRGDRLPIILRHYVGRGEVLFHATDETWRWRWRTNDQYFTRYWGQAVRRLGRRQLVTSRQGIQLSADRARYRLGEDVKLQLRFRDPMDAPADDQGVVVRLQGGYGPEQEIRLRRRLPHREIFEKVVSSLSPGEYTASLLQPHVGEETSRVRFEIEQPTRELSRLAVEVQVLIEAAEISGGKYHTLETVAALVDVLPKPRKTTIEQLPSRPLWNTHAVMALFVVVVTTEWLLRRRLGML